MPTKNATGVIETGNTAMRALAVGAFALGAGAIGTRPTDLSARDVTFPGILSDDTSPTTALVACHSSSCPRGRHCRFR